MYKLVLIAALGYGLAGCNLAYQQSSDDIGFTQNEELNSQLKEADGYLQVTRLSGIDDGNDYSVSFSRALNYQTTIDSVSYDYQNIEYYTFKHLNESRSFAIRVNPVDARNILHLYEDITMVLYENGKIIESKSAENGQPISLFPYIKQGSEYTLAVSTTTNKFTAYRLSYHFHFDQKDLQFDENGSRVFAEANLGSLADPELTYLYALDDHNNECHEYSFTDSEGADEAINSSLEYGSCIEALGSALMGYCDYTYDNVTNRRYYFSSEMTEDNAAARCIALGEVDYIKVIP
jgi:hypothetical protein